MSNVQSVLKSRLVAGNNILRNTDALDEGQDKEETEEEMSKSKSKPNRNKRIHWVKTFFIFPTFQKLKLVNS